MGTWSKIGEVVSKVAPTLGSALLGPAGGIVGNLIASAFGVENKPEAVEEAIAKDPQSALRLVEIQTQHAEALKRLDVESESNQLKNQTDQLQQVNETIRAELLTEDRYKSYWRPTFGYSVTLTWLLQGVAIAFSMVYIVIVEPAQSDELFKSMGDLIGALMIQWVTALGVLGVNIHSRTRDKNNGHKNGNGGENGSSGGIGGIVDIISSRFKK